MIFQKPANGAESSDMPTYFKQSFRISSDTPSRNKGKLIVEERIGNSYESPTYFKTEHGQVSKVTYDNPYINTQIDPICPPQGSLKNKQTFSIFSNSKSEPKEEVFNLKEVPTHSIYNLVTHQRTKGGKMILQINEKAKFNEEYKKISNTTVSPFHRKMNYFSDFAERNDHMNVFGGLNQRERPTQFYKVKDYSLDEKQASLQKLVRQNSQPSQMSKNNTSLNALSSRMSNHRTTNSEFQLLPINLSTQLSNSPLNINGMITSPTSSKSVKNMRFADISASTPINEEIQALLQQKGNGITSRQGDRTNTQPILSMNGSKSRFYGRNLNKMSSLKSRVGMRSSQQNKIQEEETAHERKCLAEFEHHLKFIQGNSQASNNQGSVFFKEAKR